MGEVNDAYLLILKIYHVEVDETTNYRKHLKQLNTEYLPNAQFVKSLRKNEPDNIVLPETVSKAMEIPSTLLNNGEIIGQLKNMADIGSYCEKRLCSIGTGRSTEALKTSRITTTPVLSHPSPLRPSFYDNFWNAQ